jgi:hypothetical protein
MVKRRLKNPQSVFAQSEKDCREKRKTVLKHNYAFKIAAVSGKFSHVLL